MDREGTTESHETTAYVGVAVAEGEDAEPSLQDAIDKAAHLAYHDTSADNVGKLFDVVRIQLVLSNPHIKELRATISASDSTGGR